MDPLCVDQDNDWTEFQIAFQNKQSTPNEWCRLF